MVRWLGNCARLGIAAVVVGGVGLVATPAQAATSGVATVVDGARITFTAAAGRQNAVVLTRSGRTVTIDDKVKIRPGKGCKRVGRDVTRVRCTTAVTTYWPSIRVYLGSRNDSLVNRSNVELWAHGGSGRDRITGGSGRDNINGGKGNDTVHGGKGDDELRGGTGNDVLVGGAGHDRFYEDILASGAGADRILGGAGTDYVSYRERTRSVTATIGAGANDGERGEGDFIDRDVEQLHGGSGNDLLVASARNVTNHFFGGAGNDRLVGGPRWDQLDGGSGNDVVTGKAGSDWLLGRDGADIMRAGAGDDRLYGDGGDDLLYGDAGNDRLFGDGGDDRLYGNAGVDSLYGDEGNDRLYGNAGVDWLYGDAGDDSLFDVAPGPNHLDGGTNATAVGDLCLNTPGGGTTVNCERTSLNLG